MTFIEEEYTAREGKNA